MRVSYGLLPNLCIGEYFVMKTMVVPFRRYIMLLALALALGALAPCAMAEGSFEAVVNVDAMTVYAQAAPHDVIGTLPRGTTVTVVAWSGKAALISANGLTGVARVSDMTRSPQESQASNQTMVANRQTRVYLKPSATSRYAAVAQGTSVQVLSVTGNTAQVQIGGKVGYMLYSHLSLPTASPEPTSAPGATQIPASGVAVVTLLECQIYENPNYSGDAITVRKGYKLTLLAVQGEVAMVTRNGTIGYIPYACLKTDTAPTPTQQVSEAQSRANPFASGSNEYIIFNFLINEMKLNRAATMGVMANIYFESSYRPVIDGDGGTSFGICQWHAGRKTNLINWCSEHNLDYTTLEGQLRFLQYELPTSYPSVDSYIRQVENTADGAYDAAYYFCFNFEAPANRTAQSTKRGNYAKDTLFPKK